nr:ribonuclease H-like domain-containing protein [Tanacetum cinerariifolium]
MLADAKLLVTFWAEAVNTACYVQNRVLVNKAHNKTPYELFNGRTPAIGFLKPFGCHVMILNTLDNLGKFEPKGDEGYFLGYLMSSKAFRVFNKRTKRVEENVHIEFLENKDIEKGSGLNWLFDIDSLTKSMNYVPVVDAGTHSTNFSEHLESTSSQPQGTRNIDVPKSSGNSNPTASSIIPPADQLETLTVETPIPTPPGFQDPEFTARVYKVEKAMYGLHQAPRACYAMGELNFFLGLQVLQKEDGIFLSQDKYVGDILKKFGYSDVRSANTPIDK